jgi:putative hydrolase of the HAD superfamily
LRLQARFPLASLSNGNADLTLVGLAGCFKVSLNARGIGAAKPDRRCFDALSESLAVPAAGILYVGDDPVLDVEAARRAGLCTAWMNRTGETWPTGMAPADLEVRDCLALAAAVGA